MKSPWINGARWDATWLIASAAVIPLGLALVWMGISSDLLNLLVTALVGGPHVFSTFLTTYLDPRFRRSHGLALLLVAVLVPAVVVMMALWNFQWLLSFFIFAASLHVLQQNAYLADVYRQRAGTRDPAWSRFLDYGVLFLSFYPIAAYKLVNDDFLLGSVPILIPSVLKRDATALSVCIAFGALLLAWIGKTAHEHRRGALNVPKTLLIGLTVTIAFLVPAAATGPRMELAFQSVNAWHSIQYLGIIWIVLKIRRDRGECSSRLIESVSGPGRAAWRFYGLCILFTVGQLALIFGLAAWDPLRVPAARYYYMGVLSVLFIHYAFDAYFFATSQSPVPSLQSSVTFPPILAPRRGAAEFPQSWLESAGGTASPPGGRDD